MKVSSDPVPQDDSTIAQAGNWLEGLLKPLEGNDLLYGIVVGVGTLVLLWVLHIILRFLILRPIVKAGLLGKSNQVIMDDLIRTKVLATFASLLALILVLFPLELLAEKHAEVIGVIERIIHALLILFAARLMVRLGHLADAIYSRLPSVNRPGALRGYVTVGSFVAYIIALVLIISVLMDKSPIYFITGLSAVSAVLLIVFRDTLLSMFANVIVTTGDLVRVGDWITVPESNADGYVIDVSLNVVKVQNFDKTITVLPTYTLVQESFVNYRGMYNAGGRRIKRSILLDQRSIRTLSEAEIDGLSGIPLMDQALKLEKEAINDCAGVDRITNSGLFRQYVIAYLNSHPKILKGDFTLLVRQLQPTPNGIPLEVYCFVDDTRWAQYEGVQATIFDQLLSVLPAFGLRVCQEESDFAEPGPVTRVVPTAPGDYPAVDGAHSS